MASLSFGSGFTPAMSAEDLGVFTGAGNFRAGSSMGAEIGGFSATPPRSYSVAPRPGSGGYMGPPMAPGMTNGMGMDMAEMARMNMEKWNGRNGIGKAFNNQDGTFDWGAVGSAAKAIGGLGELYLGFQANKQAKEEFQYMKQITDKNMANQIKDFNKAVEDQSYSRAAQNNSAAGTAEAYNAKHKL